MKKPARPRAGPSSAATYVGSRGRRVPRRPPCRRTRRGGPRGAGAWAASSRCTDSGAACAPGDDHGRAFRREDDTAECFEFAREHAHHIAFAWRRLSRHVAHAARASTRRPREGQAPGGPISALFRRDDARLTHPHGAFFRRRQPFCKARRQRERPQRDLLQPPQLRQLMERPLFRTIVLRNLLRIAMAIAKRAPRAAHRAQIERDLRVKGFGDVERRAVETVQVYVALLPGCLGEG